MPKPIDAILIGAGNRGAEAYAPYALAHPDQIRFVAVAEPDRGRRERFAKRHGIPAENCFESWEALLGRPQLGEAALICTQDWQHTQPTLAALSAGYHILLEKPMATTEQECRQLVQASEATSRQLHICHVLRYTKHFREMRRIIQSGVLGQIVNVSHRENVAWWHMAHSYVRGNWRNSNESSPMILAKCCHDFDILLWMLDRHCQHLSSTGSLLHFRPENAPAGAADRCLDCPAAPGCPYDAAHIYLDMAPFWASFAATARGFNRLAVESYMKSPGLFRPASMVYAPLRQIEGYRGWPLHVLAPDPTPENVCESLRTGPYGRCVYKCDNNVVDHQVVLMQFEGGMSVTLTMHGHSHVEHRSTRIEGSHALLTSEFGAGGSRITVEEHRSLRKTVYETTPESQSGHGGGDAGLMAAFVESIRSGKESASTARHALESHLMAFAAEQARLENRVISRVEFNP